MHEITQDIHAILEQAGAQWMGYGPQPESGQSDSAHGPVTIAEHFDAYEAEYAAIRQRVGIMVQPQRSLVRVSGADHQDYLHRMVSQDVLGMQPGQSRRSLQLGDKGRIIADMLIHHGGQETWLEMDRFDVPGLIELLEARLFVEEVTLEDRTDQHTALALYGPAAQALLDQVAGDHHAQGNGPDKAPSTPLPPGTHQELTLAGQPVKLNRRDELGVMGLHLWPESEHAPELLSRLLDAAGYECHTPPPHESPDQAADAAQRRRESLRGRPIGWQAYNTARIEAGTPIFHIDFGPDSLPPEAGQSLLDQAVAFDKGCFLGQEIVARIRNLGHPKRILVGLQLPGDEIPVSGTQVLTMPEQGVEAPVGESQVIGGITSSTVSALLGNRGIALAVMKWGAHHEGTEVRLAIEGRLVSGLITNPHFVD